jgi:2-keto-4-pentenoate hydratase/2-oxohepta-3-ene-1,7-dioic acid hydratase in catechol pathway
MKLVTFLDGGGKRLGVLIKDGVLDLCTAAERLGQHVPETMQGLIEAGEETWELCRELVGVSPDCCIVANPPLLAPLPRPVRFRDASLFIEHMEVGLAKLGKSMNDLFRRQVIYYNTDNVHIFGHEQDVPWPRSSSWRDYELEWACVIGRPGANIARRDARRHIFGVTIFNDWSARDLQFPFMECGLGPAGGKDFANSIGPCIATWDEFADPYNLKMTARVNGEVWSLGTTASMHHRFEDAIVELSADRPLVAAEVIGSGTVLGGCGFELDRRLELGDEIELEVEGIGVLKNRLVDGRD